MTQIADATVNDYKSCCYRDSKRKFWLRVGFRAASNPSRNPIQHVVSPHREPILFEFFAVSCKRRKNGYPEGLIRRLRILPCAAMPI
jgi:hypothetical protein